MKKLLGYIGVDSGQVIITDPCYLHDWKANDFQDIREYRLLTNLKKRAKKIFRYGRDFLSYEEQIYKGKTMNQLIADKEVEDVSEQYHKIMDYSYNGACNRTLYDPKQGGKIGSGEQGVVSTTGYGDGSYPVYAHYKNGRVQKLEVVFF